MIVVVEAKTFFKCVGVVRRERARADERGTAAARQAELLPDRQTDVTCCSYLKNPKAVQNDINQQG